MESIGRDRVAYGVEDRATYRSFREAIEKLRIMKQTRYIRTSDSNQQFSPPPLIQLYEKLVDPTKINDADGGSCNQTQRQTCSPSTRCDCIYIDQQLLSLWKFQRIVLAVGKYDTGIEKEVVFDGRNSKGPLDWCQLQVSWDIREHTVISDTPFTEIE